MRPEGSSALYSLCLAVVPAYVGYYLFCVVKKPSVNCNPKFLKFLEKHCPILSEKFWPTIWCVESRLQTILRVILQTRPPVQYEREMLDFPDGGQVALDWVSNDLNSLYGRTKPVVIILPGLTGTSQEGYTLHLVAESVKLGYRAVVFNYRGNGGAELKTSRTYCATYTDDLSCVISHVSSRYPQSPIMAVGVSFGGLVLTNYLAKVGPESGLVAGMTCSSPWNVFESSKTLEEPINLVCFNRLLCNKLKQAVVRYEHLFSDICDLKAVRNCVTIRDFDTNFTTKVFGYNSVDEYYRDACIHGKVQSIQIPLLCLNAVDDPFSPGKFIPAEEARNSSSVAIVVTCRGGHIGFIDGCLIPNSVGYMQRIFCQFSQAVYNFSDELLACKD